MGGVRISTRGATGIIGLDRPEAINALDKAMIDAVNAALGQWTDDPAIKAVLIEGHGERGLCAGGDVRAVRALVLEGRTEEAMAFFAAEYTMNATIARYAKPVIALQRGIVMGGGIGISSHARFRVATASSRFAMPEALIGFFCDVGVNAILAQTTRERALAFALSGMSVDVGDAIALGLTDAAVSEDGFEDMRARLIDAAQAGEPDTAIAAIIQARSIEPGTATLCALADSLSAAFAEPSAADVIARLEELADEGDPGAAAMAEKLKGLCPYSLEVIHASHLLARRQRDVDAVLETDLALARHMALRPDFAEGVRALLVDKDKAPRWTPASMEGVDIPAIAALCGGPRSRAITDS
ncbi:enoyl-CoA hydratase/isomerase family protein [Pelagibacterium montanilacus]|uniref:enoyl-CoA hydratase/isomerase family protein n=1 Tax=Pelagibacterium montanilacus TaxID=2185280 RepID=UPI000F8EF8E5|nr:enoyl-CoA hydratase/isomerase family protein [Pelagibacterium montanilacus]